MRHVLNSLMQFPLRLVRTLARGVRNAHNPSVTLKPSLLCVKSAR